MDACICVAADDDDYTEDEADTELVMLLVCHTWVLTGKISAHTPARVLSFVLACTNR